MGVEAFRFFFPDLTLTRASGGVLLCYFNPQRPAITDREGARETLIFCLSLLVNGGLVLTRLEIKCAFASVSSLGRGSATSRRVSVAMIDSNLMLGMFEASLIDELWFLG